MAWKLLCDRCGQECTDLLFRLEVVGSAGRPWQEERKLYGPSREQFSNEAKLHRDFCISCFNEVGLRLHHVLDRKVERGETDAILGRIGELADGGLCEDADGARNALADILKLVERWEQGAGVGA